MVTSRPGKYPFRNNTWFGPGHTVDIPKRFADTFEYEFVLLELTSIVFPSDTRNDNDVVKIIFLEVIPIYTDERGWIAENKSFNYMDNKFGNKMRFGDVKREHYIPSKDLHSC